MLVLNSNNVLITLDKNLNKNKSVGLIGGGKYKFIVNYLTLDGMIANY